jgi:hypothetical protein
LEFLQIQKTNIWRSEQSKNVNPPPHPNGSRALATGGMLFRILTISLSFYEWITK